MKIRIFGYFFFSLMVISVCGLRLIADPQHVEKKVEINNSAKLVEEGEDSPRAVLNSFLSALGGFGGGGLLLMFFVRRLINNYDEMFSKWDTRTLKLEEKESKRYSKLIELI